MSLAQGQIYKGNTGSYSAISSPFEYIPLPQSHVVNRSGVPYSGVQASETLSEELHPGLIPADGSFITSDEWLNYSTWSTDDWQSNSDMKRMFGGVSRTLPYNGDGLFTRNTLGAVALQGQNDSNYWSHSFAQGLSAVQNGQFTFMVGSDRDVAPGQTINGLSNALVTKRFKLVAGQTDMSSSASVTLVVYNSTTHPADWDSQWVLSTDGSQLTYYAGTNSSTNFEDLNSNINNASINPVTDGGTGYSNTGTNVATTGGSGTGMTVDFTANSGVISDVAINSQGVNYKIGDQVQVDGGTTPATFTLSANSPQSLLGQNVNGRTMVVESAAGVFGTNNMKDSVISVKSDMYFIVDSVVYQQKVNYSHEQIPSNASMVYPCVNNISEYEVINLGSDALNYSDTNVNVTLSGFYAV